MKIHEFDIRKGIYKFEIDEIETEFHAHPAAEILYSQSGEIEIEIDNCVHQNIFFAVIEANKLHKVKYKTSNILILMVECNVQHLKNSLLETGIILRNGLHIDHQKNDWTELMDKIQIASKNSMIPITNDERIEKCLHYLNSTTLSYNEIIKELKLVTHLSEGRLSHLFKAEMGISIKRFFVWSNLKKTIEQVVNGEKNMYQASIENGFYDQAHLSKAFKKIFGISPSYAYNSRMIQV
jgi:AraC-like DNA-binding protein